MSSPPDIDPYATLGVSKDATIAEIRAAHRKRVLKCHPDKIQDESQRIAAQDEFQRVQQAYELLSDETRRTRYDQKVKLAELKREVLERRKTEASYARENPREMRNGRIVEERVPMEVFLDEAMRFADDLRPTARKADEFGKRAKAKPAEEKKKAARTPMSGVRASRDAREAAKASLADRAKQRDKDRRRDASAKYEEVYEPYSARVESDDDASDSSDSIYVRLKRPSSHRKRESRSRPANISRRRDRIYDEDDYSDRYSSKIDSWQAKAQEHIERSKYEGPRVSRSPPRARGYDSPEPEVSSSRRSGRSSRTTRNPSSSRDNSYEHLDSPRVYRDDFNPPRMPSSSTSPGHKTSSIRPSLFSARTATATGFTRKREGSSREVPTLEKMAREQVREPIPPHSSRRGDSGYSSPSTPEILPRGSSPKVTTRYKIDDTVITEREPSTKPKYRSISPERPRGPPKRASTMNYASEASPRIEVRTVRPSRPHGDVEWSPRFRSEDVKYAREIRPSDASMSPSRPSYYTTRHPPPGRRQSTWA